MCVCVRNICGRKQKKFLQYENIPAQDKNLLGDFICLSICKEEHLSTINPHNPNANYN